MKIGIDARAAKWYRGTGIGTYTYQLINSLNSIDTSNSYNLFMPEACGTDIKFNNNFQVNNITQNVQNNFWDEVNIPNILMDKDAELYHVPQNGVGLPRDKNCPFVITLHDVIPAKMPETVGDTFLKIFTEDMPRIVSQCDGIITVSNYSKEDIVKTFNYPREKIYVTYLASEDIYRPLDINYCKHFIEKLYGITGSYILYVGGFSPRKNIVGLIEAFSKLSHLINDDVKLVIAGKQGKSYPIYKGRAEELNISDKVIFPGFIPVENMPYLYNAATLFAYPSFYEGFGLPPVEAMACGTPVIASNLTSVPETVGDCSILIDPYDIDDIASAILRGLEDSKLRQDLRDKGLAKASNLTWLDTAKNTLSSYEHIIK